MLLRSSVLGWCSRSPFGTSVQRVARLLLRTAAPARATVAPRVTGVTVTASAQATTKPVKETKTFNQLGLIKELRPAIEALGITTPTEIQALSLPALANGGSFLLASHTGSGKTLAYLLPVVQRLKLQEQQQQVVTRPKRPRALILGPTKELAEQIYRVAKGLAHHAKFRATCITSAGVWKSQRDALSGPVDLVVATPTKLLKHLQEGNLHLGDVSWLVVDEADTMFDQGFGEEVQKVLAAVRGKASPADVVLVSATMSKAVKKVVTAVLPDVVQLQTSSTHKAVVGSRHEFMSVPPGRDRLDLLRDIIEPEVRKGRKVLVFCNTMDSCRAVEHFCTESSVPSVCYHGDMPIPARKEAMEAFAGANPEGGQPIMVCTDLAARGLDFPGQVEHVVNFDFPLSPVDYLHRTGRTARAGRKGKITSIVTSKEKVLASRIEWALQHDEPLDRLTNDRDVLPPSQLRGGSKSSSKVAAVGKTGGKVAVGKVGGKVGAAKSGSKAVAGKSSKAVAGKSSGKVGVAKSSSKVSLKGLRGAARVDALQKVAAAEKGGRGSKRGSSGSSSGSSRGSSSRTGRGSSRASSR